MGLKRDQPYMRRYLNAVIPYGLQDPELGDFKDFILQKLPSYISWLYTSKRWLPGSIPNVKICFMQHK